MNSQIRTNGFIFQRLYFSAELLFSTELFQTELFSTYLISTYLISTELFSTEKQAPLGVELSFASVSLRAKVEEDRLRLSCEVGGFVLGNPSRRAVPYCLRPHSPWGLEAVVWVSAIWDFVASLLRRLHFAEGVAPARFDPVTSRATVESKSH